MVGLWIDEDRDAVFSCFFVVICEICDVRFCDDASFNEDVE